MSKAKGKKTRAKFNAELLERRQAYYDKMQMEKEEQLKSGEKALIDATYLHKQYHSPACWQTVEDAEANWERLKTKKDKMKHVKENILIRYLGLGWVEAHHPWSRKQNGIQHTFTSDELFQHLIEVVIPLADKKEMPLYAPVKLPELPDNFTLGTRSAVRKNLDEKHKDLEVDVRGRAKVELERMEESGITDGVCWVFQVDDEDGYLVEELRWCSGVVTALKWADNSANMLKNGEKPRKWREIRKTGTFNGAPPSNMELIKWHRVDHAVTAFTTIIVMPLTYSIAYGLVGGFLVWIGSQTIFYALNLVGIPYPYSDDIEDGAPGDMVKPVHEIDGNKTIHVGKDDELSGDLEAEMVVEAEAPGEFLHKKDNYSSS
eukprot:scaffold1438_cov85-Cyclotella_meneghiniana.AAC.1